MPPWKPEWINQHDNDDCYVEMTFLKTLEDHGFDVSIRQAGINFANSGFPLFHANLFGRNNLHSRASLHRTAATRILPGTPTDINYQIESDFAGIISPGLPNQAIAHGLAIRAFNELRRRRLRRTIHRLDV